jgi:hypothetical protein
LIEVFGDHTPFLISLILLERRPILVSGYIESRVLRELRYLTPHRDIYEFGRNVPTGLGDAEQFMTSMLGAENDSTTQPPLRRSLILAPNAESGIVDMLLNFKKAWVASSVAIPHQERVRKSNVAIYDINAGKWLNIDKSGIDVKWTSTIVREAMTKSNDELLQAYLDFVIRAASSKASALYRYICCGASSQSEIWRDLGEPTGDEREAIINLCKSEFNIDVAAGHHFASGTNREAVDIRNETPRKKGADQPSIVEKLARRMALEEKRIRECIEAVKSRI